MKIKVAIFSIVGLILSLNTYAANFYRHIYNNSAGAWVIKFFPETGNVNMYGCAESSYVQNGLCTIESDNKQVAITYDSSDPVHSGSIFFYDISKRFFWPRICFIYDNLENEGAPTIYSYCPDNRISINGTANGDITLNSI